MKSLFLAVALLLALGVIFTRNRLKLAFQLLAVAYALVLMARMVIFGLDDADNFLDLITIGVAFLLVCLVAWVAIQAVLRYRARDERPGRS